MEDGWRNGILKRVYIEVLMEKLTPDKKKYLGWCVNKTMSIGENHCNETRFEATGVFMAE